MLADYAPHLIGEWIWILDDDDTCTCPILVAGLKQIDRRRPSPAWNIDVVMVRNDLLQHGVLPDRRQWGVVPASGHVAMSCFIVRRAVFQEYAHHFAGGVGADHRFATAILTGTKRDAIHWWDVVAMRCQRVSSEGAPE